MKIQNVSAGVFQSFYANRQKYKENLKLSEEKNKILNEKKESKTKKIVAIASIMGDRKSVV